MELVEAEVKDYNKIKLSEVLVREEVERERREREQEQKRRAFESDDEENLPFVDDDDEDDTYLQSEVAYELWKVREITRIKRDQDERLKHEREQAEINRRRNMTEEERRAEDEERAAAGSGGGRDGEKK